MRKEHGITLIALAITIIVLLILAGISIGAITGDNGIIKEAKNAKTDTEKANWEEQIDQAIISAEGTNRNTDIDDVIEELINKGVINSESDVNRENGAITTKEPSYVITGKLDEYLGITSQDIANAENKDEFYGAIVKGYELPSGTTTDVNWKIFYADENNIYLIADNYVERENLPNSTTESGEFTTNKPNAGNSSYPRATSFSNILGDYAGSARITDSKLKALNNSYFNENNFTSTYDNMKAVAYMMDTRAWNSKFKDVNNKAEYAIGGPTVEMLMKSYSQKYGVDYLTRAKDATGYEISKDGGANWGKSYLKMLNINDSLYVIKTTSDNAAGMLMASPSVYGNGYLISMNYNGNVDYSNYGARNYGLRPIVCLKSDVKLVKNLDGTYAIL